MRRRDAAETILIATETGVAGLGLFFHVRSRESLLRAFREFDTPLPATAALALSGWFMPCALGAAGALTLIALLAPLRRSQKKGLLGSGLVLASLAVTFAIVAGFWPIFRPE